MTAESTEAVRDYWDSMVGWYSLDPVQVTTALFYTFAHVLKLQTARNVLEVGCGTGNGIKILLEQLPGSAQITACDLSPGMLAKAQAENFPRTTLLVANNEELPFAELSFDRYVANLSLMIVEDPKKMLNEAFRVLEPGSIAVFSVWGSKETCLYINIMDLVMEELNITVPDSRSNFYLNDPDLLRSLVKEAGFSSVICYETVIPSSCVTVDEMTHFYAIAPEAGEPEVSAAIIQKTRELLEVHVAAGRALTFSSLVAIAFKT